MVAARQALWRGREEGGVKRGRREKTEKKTEAHILITGVESHSLEGISVIVRTRGVCLQEQLNSSVSLRKGGGEGGEGRRGGKEGREGTGGEGRGRRGGEGGKGGREGRGRREGRGEEGRRGGEGEGKEGGEGRGG